MPRSSDDSDIIGTKPKPSVEQQLEGLGLFSDPAPAPVVHVPGAGQLARAEARDKTDADGDRARVLEILRQRPAGLTRRQIADELEMPINTVNARVAELCNVHRYAPDAPPCFTEGHRERVIEENGKQRPVKESIVFAREASRRA